MVKYDFDRQIERRGTGALKTDALEARYGKADLLPLWVADMDFETPPFIIEALRKRLEHPILGYTIEPADYWPVVQEWILKHHGEGMAPLHPRHSEGYRNGYQCLPEA